MGGTGRREARRSRRERGVSLDGVRRALDAAGLNLTATLPRGEYDALVPAAWQSRQVAPTCRGILVVGNGGRVLWERFRASPEATLAEDPLDRYTRRVMREAAAGAAGPAPIALYTEQRDSTYLSLVALARRAGFGTPGRVGVLIHPEFGPWIAIRGVIYLPEEVPFSEPAAFEPCTGCPAPCAVACHGSVIGPETVDVRGCFRTKILNRACRTACDARRACVVGPEHAYSREQEAHHSRIRGRPSTLRRAAGVLLRP